MGRVISKSYRHQNEMLHQMRPDYGAGGHRWASRAVDILNRIDGKSILDYGCGKGTLANVIGNTIVNEYDPAVDGKHIATPSDLVICTDVLEHIEPDLLDNVLEHLASVTLKRLFFSIATCEARKSLPDGRNAHLIVRPSFWWRARLEKYFVIHSLEEGLVSVRGEASPIREFDETIRELPEIRSFAACDEEKRFNNVKTNCARISSRLSDGIAPHGRTAVLVCYGPSLQSTWGMASQTEGDLFTVSAAHGFMVERNAIPFAQIDCDPRPHKAAQFGTPHHGVKYWLASCIHPDYTDRLVGHSISLWHLHNGEESANNIWSIEPDAWLCVGGGSVGLRSVSLLYSQGYRHFEIHGLDCSISDDGEYHAGNHLGKKQENFRIRCGDRWFVSTLSLVDYARQFLDDLRLWPGATFRVHGNGLLAHMIATREKVQ